MSGPRISVVITTYNRPTLMCEAIASVLAQTMRDFELIVVDDGSTDNTRETVQSFGDKRIVYIHQENRGLAEARNTGIRASKGEWVAFLDDDDLFLPDKLECQAQLIEQQPDVGMVTGGVLYIDQEGKTWEALEPWKFGRGLNQIETWLFDIPSVPSAVMVKREWFDRAGYFDAGLPGIEDGDMWLRLVGAGCRIGCVKSMICAYRLHATNMTRKTVEMKKGLVEVLDKFFADKEREAAFGAIRNKVYANAYLKGAGMEYAGGELQEACLDLGKAFALDPALLDRARAQTLENLSGMASSRRFALDPVAYLNTVFANLPENAQALLLYKKKVQAEALLMRAFNIYRYAPHAYPQIRTLVLRAFWADPTRLSNIGAWSIWLRSLFLSRGEGNYARR
ncbi:MAG: glycosyltransferase [Anaerolineae bacterium]